MKHLFFALLCVLLVASGANAQQVPWRLFTGSGEPEGRVRADVGDVYIDPAKGLVYQKRSGSNTATGWIQTWIGTSNASPISQTAAVSSSHSSSGHQNVFPNQPPRVNASTGSPSMIDPHAIHDNPTGDQTASLAGHNLNVLGGHVILGYDPGAPDYVNSTFGAARNAWMIQEENPPDSNALEIGITATNIPSGLEYYGTQFFTAGTPVQGATTNIIGGILVLSGLNGIDEPLMELHGIDAYTYHNTSGNIGLAIGVRAANPDITAGGTVTDSYNFYGALFAQGEASGINAIYGGEDPGNAPNEWFAYGLGKSFFKGGVVLEDPAPSVGASQIAFGGTTVAPANCGSLGFTGCLVINVGGTTRYIPYK